MTATLLDRVWDGHVVDSAPGGPDLLYVDLHSLKRVERTGFGEFLFHRWAEADPGFVLDRPEYREAVVLIASPNFGSGSSREHAAWAIQDGGIKAVIVPSFGDIFRQT